MWTFSTQQIQPSPRPPSFAPLAAVAAILCSAYAIPDSLASVTSSFFGTSNKRWTIEEAYDIGDLELLQRLTAFEAPRMHSLYQAHVTSKVLVHTMKHSGALELLECLHAFCPTADVNTDLGEAAFEGKVDVMEWLVANYENVEWIPSFSNAAAYGSHLDALQWLKTQFTDDDQDWQEECASFQGHLEIVKRLHDTGPVGGDRAMRSSINVNSDQVDRKALTYLFEHDTTTSGSRSPAT